MKKVLLAICLVCLAVSYSMAGDIMILPDNSQPSGSTSDGMDIYVVTNDKGQTKSVTVIQLDENLYVATDSNGNSTTIFKLNSSNNNQWE